MAGHGSKFVIYAALAGNGLIAITKFIASAYTGSSAMFSEAIHSLVDTGNQGLLLYGMKRAARPADDVHPYGYGRELYFWAFIVAILIFSVGGGISIYEGVHKLDHPEPITSPFINYIVLALAIVFESGSTYVALREFRKTTGQKPYMQALRASKDPALYTVLLEDMAALIGLVIALIGSVLTQALDLPMLDGITSIAIGVVLIGTAVFLCIESKSLLIGESASTEIVQAIHRIIARMPEIQVTHAVLTQHLSSHQIMANISVDFRDDLTVGALERTIGSLRQQIQQAFPDVSHVFVEATAIEKAKKTAS
ncbi:MAG: cation diffusion facilitator family transporter [Rickettsiales bacterium]|nr:cation diffusion facilitator family transporter [Rickettsiales bacterium]